MNSGLIYFYLQTKLPVATKKLFSMKKWILTVSVLVVVIISILYFLIPANQNAGYQTVVNCTQTASSRKIIYTEKWKLWWPGEKINDTLYKYQNYTYSIDKILLNGIEITISDNKSSVKGFFQFGYYGHDSTRFDLTYKNNFSSNPLKRFQQYFQLKGFESNVISLLGNIRKYFDNPENIYRLNIIADKVVESSLISLKKTFQHYPSTIEIYQAIDSVKGYIKKAAGEEAGFPMLHVENRGPENFELMVAIPTTNELPTEGQFLLKRMHAGYALTAEVTGGVYRVMDGERELANYIIDYKINSPAIPFQSLVTNRLQETDTTKWITKLNYPVFK